MVNLPLFFRKEHDSLLFTPPSFNDSELGAQQHIRRTKLIAQISVFITVNTALSQILSEACEILDVEISCGTTSSGGATAWVDQSPRQGGTPGSTRTAQLQQSVNRFMRTTFFAQPGDLFAEIAGNANIFGITPQSLVTLTAWRGYIQQF